MDDGELAILSRGGIRVYDRQLRPVEKKHHHVDWEVDAAEKGGYDHFMLKEIYEQPAAVRRAITGRIRDGRVITANKNTIPNDPQSPFVTSGIRLGTPAVTSRGLNTEDMDQVAEAIALVIKGGEEQVPAARAIIQKLTDKYPLI